MAKTGHCPEGDIIYGSIDDTFQGIGFNQKEFYLGQLETLGAVPEKYVRIFQAFFNQTMCSKGQWGNDGLV